MAHSQKRRKVYKEGQKNRQLIIDAINAYQAAHNVPPTLREVASETGISLTAVVHHVNVMYADNLVTFEPGKRRTLRVL